MSGATPPAGRRRFRDKFKFLAPSRPVPNNTTDSHTEHVRPPFPSRSSTLTDADHSGLPSQAIQRPAAVLTPFTPQPSTLPPSTHNDIVENAWRSLPDRHREVLAEYMPSASGDSAAKAMEQSLAAAKQWQQTCDDKRWKFNFAGRTVVLKEAADKVVHWLDRFKAVGDLAASIDPVHVGLPWAGVCFILKIAVAETDQMAALLVGCETALYMVNRLKAYMEFLVAVPSSISRSNFEKGLTELHTLVLSFLAQAIGAYKRSTVMRPLAYLWHGSDVQDFEQNCDKVGNRVEIEARNCDRTLSGQDRTTLQQLQETLKEMQQSRQLQEALKQLEMKIDLGNLKFVQEAAFDVRGQVRTECHPDTRVDLLRDIQNWARHPESRNMFWLQGMAGTGKSAISCTMAQWLCKQGPLHGVDLGASFFFKQGEGNCDSAALLFPTIAHQLARKMPGLGVFIAEAVADNPDVCSKKLGEQFQTLIHQPIKRLSPAASDKMYIVVIDALDECKTEDIDVVLQLWSKNPPARTRLFLTSRPDLPLRNSFRKIPKDTYQELILHDVPTAQVQNDILVFLMSRFATIRGEYDFESLGTEPLDDDWPGAEVLQELAAMAIPLFIVASTMCLFISDSDRLPPKQLAIIMDSNRQIATQMEKTYLPVLQRLTDYDGFQYIVGSIVTLAEPMSKKALATLLQVDTSTVVLRLQHLSSVLHNPRDPEEPVRRLHLSFAEFLTSDGVADQPFGVNSLDAHKTLLTKCIELLSQPSPLGLHENMCRLSYPGQPRRDLAWDTIQERLSSAMRYACQYWTHHAKSSKTQIIDHDGIHKFLQRHFLHWLEALSLLDCGADAITHVETLRSLVSPHDSVEITALLNDARRFVLSFRYIINIAPLQLYSSAIIFTPQESAVRESCGRLPDWITQSTGTPLIWGPELQQLEGHTDAISAVAFSSDGILLASASWDTTVRLWNAETGQEVQKLEGSAERVNAVVFSPNGSQLASASDDNTIRLWDVRTGREMQTLEGATERVNAVAFSPDGSQLASASDDMIVRLWDTGTGREVQKLEGHTQMVWAVAFSPNGTQLASASYDATVRLWDVRTGQEVQKLEGHTHGITSVTFSPDGNRLASASYDNTVRLYDVRTGQEVQKLEGHTDNVQAVVFSPDGSQLASASRDATIRLWDTRTGQEIQELQGHTDVVYAAAFSPNGRQLASASHDKTIRLWDSQTEQQTQRTEGHSRGINMTVFSPDGSQLASTSNDMTVRLWDTRTGRGVQKLKGHTGEVGRAVFSPNGTQLASASYDMTVRLWDVQTGQEVQKIEGQNGVVIFSPDGSQLASASGEDAIVQLWDISTGRELQRLEGHAEGVYAVAFSPDGSQLASGSGDTTVRLWDVSTGREVQKLEGHAEGVYTVAFSPDNSRLASASDDTTVRLWDVSTGREVWKLEGHIERVDAVAFSPDGNQLASASSDDETIRLWDTNSGDQIQVWKEIIVRDIRFARDGQTLLTDRGIFPINTASPSSQNDLEKVGKPFVIKDDWIECQGEKLLWLPPAYRTHASAVHDDLLALGRQVGTVVFLKLRYM